MHLSWVIIMCCLYTNCNLLNFLYMRASVCNTVLLSKQFFLLSYSYTWVNIIWRLACLNILYIVLLFLSPSDPHACSSPPPLSLPPSLTHPLFILHSHIILPFTTALAIELVQISPSRSVGAEVIHTVEDSIPKFNFRLTGYSYSYVDVQVSILTYSEYAARGFNLQDEFDASVIPTNAADGMLCDIAKKMAVPLVVLLRPLVSEFMVLLMHA